MFWAGTPDYGAYKTPQAFNSSSLNKPGQIGLVDYRQSGDWWQIVKIVDAANTAAGDALYWKDKRKKEVTPTIGNSSAGECAGFAEVIATAANYYIAIRQGGLFSCKALANTTFADGTPVMADSGNNRIGPAGSTFRVPLGDSDAAAGILSWLNPFTHALRVMRLGVDRTTASTGAGTADFGFAATAISNDLLLDGLDINAAAAFNDNIINPGTNGLASVSLAAGSFITGSKASGAAAGLVGFAYIHVIHRAQVNLQVLGVAQGAVASGKVSTMLSIIPG